jgi:hypothetical protein
MRMMGMRARQKSIPIISPGAVSLKKGGGEGGVYQLQPR